MAAGPLIDDTPDGGGSVQLRQYLKLRRGGMERADACFESGMSLTEAVEWDADERAGKLGWVGKPDALACARARARGDDVCTPGEEPMFRDDEGGSSAEISKVTMKAGDGPEIDITKAIKSKLDAVKPGSASALRSFIERIENIEDERKSLADDKADVFKEAKAQGFNLPVMKGVLSRRKKAREEGDTSLEEWDTLIAVYERAVTEQIDLPLGLN